MASSRLTATRLRVGSGGSGGSAVFVAAVLLLVAAAGMVSVAASASASAAEARTRAALAALAPTPAESLPLAKALLRQALVSASGKVTTSPEVAIPTPSDPTAVLLQSAAVRSASEGLRCRAKANAVFVECGVGALRGLCAEQDEARGSFPGPVPVVYCGAGGAAGAGTDAGTGAGTDAGTDADADAALADVADAGACGLLVRVHAGKPLSKRGDDIAAEGSAQLLDAAFGRACRSALAVGLQPVPELVLSCAPDAAWTEADVETIVAQVTDAMDGHEPAALLLTPLHADRSHNDTADSHQPSTLPPVPKALAERVPVLASIRAPAGGGRIGASMALLKTLRYVGAVLRTDCVPPSYRYSVDIDSVSDFWVALLSDLKSTRSKTFGFRAKVATPGLDRDVPSEWIKYQKAVMESGALGTPDAAAPDDFNPDAGDYRGF